MLKKIIISFLLLFWLINFISISEGWGFYWIENTKNIYESAKDWLTTWITQVKDTVAWIEKDQTASEYIQGLVIYILSFLSLIAVIYIIYAWMMIMISGWDEEKLKAQKKTIISVIIWIVVIWLAYSIVLTVFNWLENEDTWWWTAYEQID